jgi:hypothetical protein
MSDANNPIRPEESLLKMIASLKEKTGKTLEEWKVVAEKEGWAAHGEIVKGLKTVHGVSHGYANQIALRVRDSGAPVDDPVEEMLAKRPEAKAVYEVLLPKIQEFGSDVDLAPKKGYVSVRRSKQFAILQPAAGRLDVGIQLKGVEPEGRLEASGSFNAMLTHRVRVSSPTEVDPGLLTWLRRAYEAAG